MQQIIYNINYKFTFNNVCRELTKFWLNEIIVSNSPKIWLSIIVYNKNNKSYVLINNLPFNTLDYTDIIIVLKQVFEAKILSNRKDFLNKIIFKFYFENKSNLKNYNFIWYILIYLIYIITILLIFITLIICLDASQITYNLANDQIFSISDNNFKSTVTSDTLDTLSTKQCIFNPFIKVFSSTYYFPSYFLPTELRVDIKYLNLLEDIYYKQLSILDNNYKLFIEYTKNTELLKYDLNAIITEYISTIK